MTKNNMDKDLQTRVAKLEIELARLKKADDQDSLKYWREKLTGRSFGANDTAVTNSLGIAVDLMTGLGTIDVLDFPDGFIDIIKPNGDRVRVPYYSLSRF